MTLLVTGSAGFIGSNFLIDWFKSSQEQIISLDKLTYAGNISNFNFLSEKHNHIFYKGDIGDTELVSKLFKKYNPRAIINFAAESHVDRSILGPDDFIKTNIIGTFKLLESVRRYYDSLNKVNAEKFRFLHISTDEVYGTLKTSEQAFKEDNPYKPNSPYSASKASSDHLVRAWHHTYEIPTLTTNCSNNYGPFHFPEKLIPLCILNAINGKELPIYGDGMQIRDWLYVSDHCSAIRLVLKDGDIGNTYNIGGSNEKTNLEVIHTLCSLLDELKPRKDKKSYKSQISFVEDRKGHDRRYAIDNYKICNELGWQPKETFESGLKKTVVWYLENDSWIKQIGYNKD